MTSLSTAKTIHLGLYSYDQNALLGKGATGSVYKGCKNDTKEVVAVKVIDLYQIND